jgi:hypothetical protein
MNDTLHFALEYFDRGWSVLPIHPMSKRPAITWRTCQKRRLTICQLKQWFGTETECKYNVGIVTGRISDLVVIDCDSADDARWWRANYPKTPLAVESGGGGTHFYYRYPHGRDVGNRTRVLVRRIDVRGEGGLVVAPPSRHPESSATYRWQPWDYYAIEEAPIFDIAWLREVATGLHSPRYVRHNTRAIRDGLAYIRRIEAVSGNGGHNATWRAACSLREAGLTPDEALEALADWNETNAKPPWSRKELVHKIEDAYALTDRL